MSLIVAAPICAQAGATPLSLSSSPLSFTLPSHLSLRHSLKYPLQSFSLSPSPHSSFSLSTDDFQERVIGDCVVFEEGAFEDPCVFDDAMPRNSNPIKSKPKKGFLEIEPENLVPDKWREAQAEINITKKERRKISQQLEFGTRVEKKRKGLLPLRQVNLEEYSAYREAKLAQLKPLVLDNPASFPANKKVETEELNESRDNESLSQRVTPKNPRWAVYGKNLDDVSEFFNSDNYVQSDQKSEGRRKLFTKEENAMVNRRVPELAAATSDSWLPLHTLAASGELFFVGALLKHNVDVNAADRIGLTALHKAILGKKQAITNYLLRESANPFVLDNDGATLLHYAVQTASSQGIKVLLLYDVDINSQDNNGWTALHLAVQARRTDIVKLLLIKGADKTLKNREGLTALELCLHSGRDTRTYELIKILKQFPKSKSKQPSESDYSSQNTRSRWSE